MPKYKKYFIVEYRIPIQVDDIDTVMRLLLERRKSLIDFLASAQTTGLLEYLSILQNKKNQVL